MPTESDEAICFAVPFHNGLIEIHIESGGPTQDFTKQNEKEKRIMETKPTHEQAQLHLQVYDLRREARLRQARDWFFKNYHAETFDDAMRIAAPGTEEGAFVNW